jgi:hypothetical protein
MRRKPMDGDQYLSSLVFHFIVVIVFADLFKLLMIRDSSY